MPVEVVTDSGRRRRRQARRRACSRPTIDALGLPPERILHIGDSVVYDVDGAAAVGMQAVHMDPFGLCDGDHPHVRALGELLDLHEAALASGPTLGTVDAMFI